MTESEEIRLTIAKLKGFYNIKIRLGELSGMTKEFSDVPIHVKNWPESIADAFELFEEMPHPRILKHEDGYSCWYDGGSNHFSAETAPLAICKANIQWKQSQVPEPSTEVMYDYE